VLAIAFVGLMAAGAGAQVPFFQLYFDDNSNGSYGETQANCGPINSQQNVYLVMQNLNEFVQAVDYQVVLPPALLFVFETFPAFGGETLKIGATPATISTEGIALAYSLPRNGFEPLLLTTLTTFWTGACSCDGSPIPLSVGPYPGVGKTSPTAIRWPDFLEVGAVGMVSLLCPGPVAVQETTWGGVKALYR
jgi:hypothetical protein